MALKTEDRKRDFEEPTHTHPNGPLSNSDEGISMSALGEERAVWNFCSYAAVKRASRQLGQLYDDVLAPSGLRTTQFSLLTQIMNCSTPSPKQLARALVMDLSALGHTLKPLIRDGLVTISPDVSDRRVKRLTLTDLGKAKRAEAGRLWKEAQRRFDDFFGKESAEAIRRTLNKISSEEFKRDFGQPGQSAR